MTTSVRTVVWTSYRYCKSGACNHGCNINIMYTTCQWPANSGLKSYMDMTICGPSYVGQASTNSAVLLQLLWPCWHSVTSIGLLNACSLLIFAPQCPSNVISLLNTEHLSREENGRRSWCLASVVEDLQVSFCALLPCGVCLEWEVDS